MELTKQEFEDNYKETLDALITAMAENAEVDVNKFYSMTCFLENLGFFSPVIWGLIEQSKKTK